MFGWFRRKKPAPPVIEALPSVVVRASGAASGAGGTQRLPPGGLRMEDVMGAAAVAAMEEGIVDHAVVRERKLQAREALKKARAEVLATGKPVGFSVGTASFVVAP